MTNTQLAVLVAAIFVSVGLAALILAPPEKLAAIGNYLNSGAPERRCLTYVKEQEKLKDPDSAELVSSRVVKIEGRTTTVAIQYKAKNAFGAYLTSEFECEVNGDLTITSWEQRRKDLEKFGISLD